MDSIFEDDSEGVGSEVEAYCPSPRCKADTNHTIISMYEDEVRRVQCVVCGDVHAYRRPRGDVDDEPPEPPVRKFVRKPTWEQAMARVTERELAACRPYSIRDTYVEGDVVSHPTFHVGFVTELLPDNKCEITFKDERRILVHNRSDLASKMPSVADTPVPRVEEDSKRKKKRRAKQADRPNILLGTPHQIELSASELAALEAAAERVALEKLEHLHAEEDAPAKGKKAGKPANAAKAAAKVAKADGKPAKASAKPAKVPSKARAAVKAKAAPAKAKTKAKAKPVKAAAPVKSVRATGGKKTVKSAPAVKKVRATGGKKSVRR